ncbi:MAG TPA: efflux transporter outer membrane subunit, partial [Candidatus Dormibacteraeota bacterium]|nr:efflux transporter outer membrane subunit [Candidatus Dormibacteraeota bacterium]
AIVRQIFFRAGSALLLAFFLCGCAVGPNYHRPDVATAPAWKEQPPWRTADPKDSIPKGSWWTTFTDSELDQYESQALKSNQTIEIARYQLEQARASARITQSGLFPHLGAGVSGQRLQTSAGRPTTTGIPLTAPSTSNDFLIPFNLTWEADLFGGIRRSVESANATYQSSAAGLENVRLVITSELAVDYFSLRELDAEIAVVNSSVEYQTKSLTLVQNRHAGGVASGLDVAQQETLLNSTRTQATLLRRQRAQFEHAIAALVGVPASSFSVPVRPLALAPPAVPIGVPSDVLERRPDVAQSERQMAAQNAQIGVAKSAYYPGINLSAGGGFENTTLGSIVGASTGFWALGANVAETVISSGRRRAQVDFAKSGYGASVANYRQTVLTAFQEVEDSLSGLGVLAEAAETQQLAVNASQRALQIANDRYTGGLVTYLDVINAEQNLLDTQRLATQILGQRLVTSVSLVKALGGGWDSSSLQAIRVKATIKQAIEP